MGGLDFSFLKEYFPVFLEGAKWTLIISAITVILGALLGTILCFMKRSKFSLFKVKILRVISTAYVEVIRGTPLLLQIYIVYFGLPSFGIQLEVTFMYYCYFLKFSSLCFRNNKSWYRCC